MNLEILVINIGIVIYVLGIMGIIMNRKNIILMLMSLELILLGVNIIFISSSVYLNDIVGQIFSIIILTVAAAESAIGLAIIVAYYRIKGSIAIKYSNIMKS